MIDINTISSVQFKKFVSLYEDALKNKKSEFTFEGQIILVAFAKHLLHSHDIRHD
tara:strand:+ start:195 stop:359 length:165 start_codon:yes stop_codon:yes gene_type:complete